MFPPHFSFYPLEQDTLHSKRARIQALTKIENKECPSCIFTVFGPSYHRSSCPKVVGFAIPYIIYDNSPYFKQISIVERFKWRMLGLFKTICFKRNSTALVFETDHARNSFVTRFSYSKPTWVVPNTLNEIFSNPQRWQSVTLEDSRCYRVLLLAANYKHKNFKVIPEGIKIMTDKCPELKIQFMISITKEEAGFSDEYDPYICYLGKVSLPEVPALYQFCDIVFIPSLLEVFSTTYLEAMYLSRPIVAADMGFSRDICGDAALYCTADDPASYANALAVLCKDSSLRKDLIENGKNNLRRYGTSMDRTLAYLNIMQEIVDENTK